MENNNNAPTNAKNHFGSVARAGCVWYFGTAKSADLTILKVANLATLINGLKLLCAFAPTHMRTVSNK